MPHVIERSSAREIAKLPCRLRGLGGSIEGNIVNVSRRGMMIEASVNPPRGAMLEIIVGSGSVVGQVKWANASRFGLALGEDVNVRRVAAGAANALARVAADNHLALAPGIDDDGLQPADVVWLAVAAVASLGFLSYAAYAWMM